MGTAVCHPGDLRYCFNVIANWSLSHPDVLAIGSIPSGWLNYWQHIIQMTNYWQFLIRITWLLAVSYPDDLPIGSISSGWLMGIAGCHQDDFRYSPISSGWHNIIWTLSHPDEIAMLIPKSSGWLSYRLYLIRTTYGYCSMSSGWLLNTALCHPDDISYHHMSHGWLSRSWLEWHTLPFLSHPDEIAIFDFPQHAVVLQCFRN